MNAEAFAALKTENPEEVENLTYVRNFLNGYFPTSEVAFSEINRIRAEFTQIVLSGSYGEEWDRKKLEASAESVYKLVKDTPASNVAIAVVEEKKEEPKPRQESRGDKRGRGRDNRGRGGKNRQPVQEPAKDPVKPATPEAAEPAKAPEPEEAKAPKEEEPAAPEVPEPTNTWADQEDEQEEEEEDEWETAGAKTVGYKKKKQEEKEKQ